MIAEKLVELKILLRRACICKQAGNNKKSTLNLRTKLLFLLKDRPRKASDVIGALSVAKPNATALWGALEAEGLLVKTHGTGDRREVTLEITEAGKQYLAARLEIIESGFKNILTDENEYSDAENAVDEVISLLSFLE